MTIRGSSCGGMGVDPNSPGFKRPNAKSAKLRAERRKVLRVKELSEICISDSESSSSIVTHRSKLDPRCRVPSSEFRIGLIV
jgi:hypothetical protein